jgi:two-component system alkaline phosphatase synthesis response regulator PhoP
MENKRILIIDDDSGILVALEMLLVDAGYEVQTSTKNGEVVENAVRDRPPDLIILDILLSGHDGGTICRQLKSQQHTRHIPILLISAHPDARAMSVQAGADAFVPKPFDIDFLLDRIERLLHPGTALQ